MLPILKKERVCIPIKNIRSEKNFSNEYETKDKDTNTIGLSTSKANDTKKKGRVKNILNMKLKRNQ